LYHLTPLYYIVGLLRLCSIPYTTLRLSVSLTTIRLTLSLSITDTTDTYYLITIILPLTMSSVY